MVLLFAGMGVLAFQPELYPPDWRALRQRKLEAAGYRCESCGIAHMATRQNTRTGANYLVYLSIAHKKQYETWKVDADTMVLCQRCHRRYDRQLRRKAGQRHHTPIGYASLYLEHHGRKVLVEMARTYDELRDVVAALPDGVQFEVHLVVNQAVVGNGMYQRHVDEIVMVHEFGACQGLPL
jgi:hypothetical protein